jgi:hypothetical protein
MRVEHAAALEPHHVMFAGGLHHGDSVALKALGNALMKQPRLGRLHPQKFQAGQRRSEAQGVSVADVSLGHHNRWCQMLRNFFGASYGVLIRGWFDDRVPPLAERETPRTKEEAPMRVRTKLAALAATAAMALGAGVAVAHDGGGRGPGGAFGEGRGGPGFGGGFGAIGCDIPAAQLIAVESNRQLKNYKTFLDEEVADGVMTQARANRLLSRAQKSLSFRKIMKDTMLAPVAKVLGFASVAELETALKTKDLMEIADEKNVTDEALRTAHREGRTAARAKSDELCGTDG